MKNSKLILAFSFIFAITAASGQDYAFKVLANKGTNEVKSGNSWEAIKTGASLNTSDEVRLSENAYLGLIHKTGKPLEVKKAGPHKVADLAAQIQGEGTSVLNKYTDFILSSNSAEAKKNRLSATGAVTRSFGDIKVYLPENQFSGVFNKKVIVNWSLEKGGAPFVVTFKNMFDDELMKIETPENSVEVSLTDPKLANESAILIEVKSKEDSNLKSEQHLIKKLSPAEQERVTKALAEIKSVVDEETALNKFIMAGFYEENKLYIDAITAYEEAIKMAPDVATYKEAYEGFLIRNRLDR
jgi:tetratricopeptide (TPR) repeat protein